MMTELAQRKNSEHSNASETHTFNYQANSHVQQSQQSEQHDLMRLTKTYER